MPTSITVSKNAYQMLLLSLVREYDRKDMLLEADEMSEAFGVPVAECVEGMILPAVISFMEQNSIPKNLADKMLARVFADFSAIVLSE